MSNNIRRLECRCGDYHHFLEFSINPDTGECAVEFGGYPGSMWERVKTAYRIVRHGEDVFSETYVPLDKLKEIVKSLESIEPRIGRWTFLDALKQWLRGVPGVESFLWRRDGDYHRFVVVADKLGGKQLEELASITIDAEMQWPEIPMTFDLLERRGESLEDIRPRYEGEVLVRMEGASDE